MCRSVAATIALKFCFFFLCVCCIVPFFSSFFPFQFFFFYCFGALFFFFFLLLLPRLQYTTLSSFFFFWVSCNQTWTKSTHSLKVECACLRHWLFLCFFFSSPFSFISTLASFFFSPFSSNLWSLCFILLSTKHARFFFKSSFFFSRREQAGFFFVYLLVLLLSFSSFCQSFFFSPIWCDVFDRIFFFFPHAKRVFDPRFSNITSKKKKTHTHT